MAHYIDKDALVAELKERIRNYWSDTENAMGIYPYALEEVIKYVDTLDVKEVDLEKELIEWHKEHFKKDGTFIGKSGFYLTNNSQMDIAKHFFELGLKAK